MKLYQTPGGTWAGNEKDWIAAFKAEGGDPKKYTGRKTVEVPTAKPDLMEFLTFHSVNVVNPQPIAAPEVAPVGVATPLPPAPPPDDTPAVPSTVFDLDAAFSNAPIRQQLRLAVSAIDAADAVLVSGVYTPAAA